MKKSEMIEKIATDHDLSKAVAGRLLETFTDMLINTLKKEGRISLSGFGTFNVTSRAARRGRNPATGESIKIKATKNVRFKAAPSVKEAVAKFKVK